MKRILYVAGRSGGHIIPALTCARKEYIAGARIFFVAEDTLLDRQLLSAEAFIDEIIFLPKCVLGRVYPFKTVLAPFLLVWSSIKAFWILRRLRITDVVSLGGIVSLPICFAATLCGVPYELYELNVEPGKAVRLLAWRAAVVHVVFEQTMKQLPGLPTQLTRYPLVYDAAHKWQRHDAYEFLHIAPTKRSLLILGGSQGSRGLNMLVVELLQRLSVSERKALHLIHQTGSADREAMEHFYRQYDIDHTVFAFTADLAVYYSAADYVISRAGSGVLHEIALFGLVGIIVPLELRTNMHQVANAQAFCTLYKEKWELVRECDPDKAFSALRQLLQGAVSNQLSLSPQAHL